MAASFHHNGTSPEVPLPRLLPHVVSQRARDTPEKIWGSIPVHPTDASQGYEDITYARLNYAISRAAQWIQTEIGPQKNRPFEALVFLAPPDSRYIVFAIAAIKAGFQMLFLSPRNSDEAQESVIQQAHCQKFLVSTSMEARVTKLLEARSRLSNMTTHVIPEERDLLKDNFVPDFPYERTLEEARSQPLLILHTSSTTGIPKTVPLNQGYGLHEDVLQHVCQHDGLDLITRKPFYGDVRMFTAMPLFHAGGVLVALLKSLYHDVVSVFQPPSAALNSELFDQILRYGNCNGCVIPPYLLEDMLTVPSYFDTLASLEFVQFGSGPLSKAAGDQLLTRQKNCPHYIGSSECGLYLLLELDDPVSDWQYFRFHPWSGIDMRPLGDGSNTREMFIVRREASKIPGVQPVFELFPDLQEWPTRDLYVQHPTKSDHWRYIGRNDDVLVLSNGEKLNPVDTEGRLANVHPSITAALVIGQGQFAPALLLEVKDVDVTDPMKRAELIEAIWPSIRAANKEAPGHGQLNKSLILFTSPGKPFLRTPKLSIRRKPTIDSYAKEIEDMYRAFDDAGNNTADGGTPSAQLDSKRAIQDLIKQSLQSISDWEDIPAPDADLFAYGMDSLQVARLGREIKRAISGRTGQEAFTARLIYRNPTIGGLAKAVYELSHSSNGHNEAEDRSSTREEEIEKLITKYSDFDFSSDLANGHPSSITHDGELNILLTGSTGSLGGHLLQTLLSNPRVRSIYCLNRSTTAKEHSLALLAAQGCQISSTADLENRVHFLHTESLSSHELGLTDTNAFQHLRTARITHIIHNAWPVNFNLSLASFAPHVAGVRALIDFASCVSPSPEVVFVSSLSSVTALSTREKVPEEIVLDPSSPAHMGYGESKYVAERVLDSASRASHGDIATTILRVGQIAGPVEGSKAAWPAREWFPSLVISSKTVGAVPDSLGRMDGVDWIPVDVLSECIGEVVAGSDGRKTREEGSSGSTVFHLVNPNVVPWEDLLPTISHETGTERIISLSDWIDLVRDGPDETASELHNPARKILPFYEALQEDGATSTSKINSAGRTLRRRKRTRVANNEARFEVKKMAKKSETFRQLKPVNKEWMAKWMKQWLDV